MEQFRGPVRLVSANIEGRTHFNELVIPFLQTQQPEIVLLQEIFEEDLYPLADQLNMKEAIFAPMCRRPFAYRQLGDLHTWGVAILSAYPLSNCHKSYYDDLGSELPIYLNPEEGDEKKVVLSCETDIKGTVFRFATTHFTWTPDGEASKEQRVDLSRLLQVLEGYDGILTGDFNAPRGKEIWGKINQHFIDWIPEETITTIDGKRHRAGDLPLVVDGVWSTENYFLDNVKVQNGLSDHCAVLGQVYKLR